MRETLKVRFKSRIADNEKILIHRAPLISLRSINLEGIFPVLGAEVGGIKSESHHVPEIRIQSTREVSRKRKAQLETEGPAARNPAPGGTARCIDHPPYVRLSPQPKQGNTLGVGK
jgi:hypothetical protein